MFGYEVKAPDLARTSRAIRKHANAKEIRKELTAGLRQAARPALSDVKSVAVGLAAQAPDSDFRKDMAAALAVQVRASGKYPGVKIRMRSGKLGDRAGITRKTNRPGWWRHPVFGTDTWVRQDPGWSGWFDRTLQRRGPFVRREVKKVLDLIEKRLTHHA